MQDEAKAAAKKNTDTWKAVKKAEELAKEWKAAADESDTEKHQLINSKLEEFGIKITTKSAGGLEVTPKGDL